MNDHDDDGRGAASWFFFAVAIAFAVGFLYGTIVGTGLKL